MHSKFNPKKLFIIASVTLLVLALTFFPIFMPDGTEKYSGKEKEAVAEFYEMYPLPDDSELSGILKRHIDKVEKISDKDADSNWVCEVGGGDGQTYDITVTSRTFFWIAQSTHAFPVCVRS